MKKIIYIIFAILIVLIGTLFYLIITNKKEVKNIETSGIEIEKTILDIPVEDNDSYSNEEKNVTEITSSSEENNYKSTKVVNKTENTYATTKSITTTKISTSKKTTNKKDVVNHDNPSTTTKSVSITTTTKKQEVWEALGISKDDYYNKPAHSWERVDFKTYKECYDYGYSYEPYINGDETFNCSEITSLSGKFLGIMFGTEKNIKDRS